MKLRIRGNSIRIRLTQPEVETFRADETIEESVSFSDQSESKFYYALNKTSKDVLLASFVGGKITVSVPRKSAAQWVDSEEIAIEGTAGELKILIEKDFACLTPRKGEDESDKFPNPNLGKS